MTDGPSSQRGADIWQRRWPSGWGRRGPGGGGTRHQGAHLPPHGHLQRGWVQPALYVHIS